MSVILRTNTEEIKPMKVMDMSTLSAEKAYLTNDPKNTHSKSELEAVIRAIEYTKLMKHEESMSKMDEEELLSRPLPRI